MSRRAALIMLPVGSAAAGTSDPRPPAPDATIASMRPDGRSIGTLTVGPGRDYPTISAALSAAATMQQQRLTAEGGTRTTPNHRVDIIVAPGTYTEIVSPPAWTALYAESPQRGATKVTHTNADGVTLPETGTLITAGALYWEGIDVELIKPAGQSGNWPKYAVHHAGIRTTVFARCNLTTRSLGTDLLGAIGMDGEAGSTTVLYDCHLSTGGTNMHGWPDNHAPLTLAYIQCTNTGGAINLNSLGSGQPDQLWITGGTTTGISASGATLHLDPATTITGPVTTDGPTDSRTDWPTPAGGLSTTDRAFYGM